MSSKSPLEDKDDSPESSDIPKRQKPLNQLSYLLETGMCTSVTPIGKKLYISANEFSSKTQSRAENQQVDFICNVMEYFRDIASSEDPTILDKEEIKQRRDELMRLIYATQIKVAFFGRMRVSLSLISKIINSTTLVNEELPREITIREKGDAHLILGLGLGIFRRMRKVENAIVNAIKGNFEGFSADDLAAFKNFEHVDVSAEEERKSDILFFQLSKGVHAELHTLSRIVEQVQENTIPPPNEIHLGISKRCCFNCHFMIEAANEILKEKNVSIIAASSHFQEYSENWVVPDIFRPGVKSIERPSRGKEKGRIQSGTSEDPESFAYKIGALYAQKIAIQQKVEVDPNQRHSSGSEHSLSVADKLAILDDAVGEKLASYESSGDHVSENSRILRVGGKLLDNKDAREILTAALNYFDVYHDDLSGMDPKAPEEYFLSIQGNLKLPENEVEYLLKFLQNKVFSTPEISGFFSSLEGLKIMRKIQEKEEGDVHGQHAPAYRGVKKV